MTIDELRSAAAVVRDATVEKENTAFRVGQLLINMIDTLVNLKGYSIKGYVIIDDVNDLPDKPTTEQQMKGYLLGTTLYVWVGNGGDTLDGKYQSADLKGEDGKPGKDGVSLGDVAIADDLDTDDPQQVLSARQGKVLAAMTSAYTYPTIDVSVGANTGAIVPAAGGHIWSTTTSYKGRCFDVSDMRGWRLHIRHGESVSICSFAFLNATPVNGQPISYCDGETFHSGVSEAEVIVPADATLLYVQRLTSAGINITPIVEILTKDKETMYSLVESVNELKEHEFDPTTVVDTPIQAVATKSGYYLEKSGSDGLQRGDMHTGGSWRIVLFEVTVGDVVSITTSGNAASGAPMYAAWYSEPDVEEGSEVIDSLSHDSYVNYAVLNIADSNKKNTVTVPSGAVYLAISLSTSPTVGRTQVTKQETVNRIDLLEDKVAVLEDGGETMTLNGRLKAIEGSSSIIDTTTRKVLIFGNSYSYDAFGFLPHIIKVSNAGLALTLGVCMDGSQTLAGQLAHANNPSSYYTRYSKHNGSSWATDYHKSFDSAVEDEDWDLIVFHQSSNLSCSLSSITPYLPQLISHLRNNGYTGKIGWLVTPAYAEGTTSGNVNKLSNVANTLGLDHTLTTDEMQHRIYDVADYLKSHYAIDVVFPCGMAIGYARHSVLDNIGEWSPADALGGNLVYKDGHHLQYGVGNLVESWVAALVLTRGRCAMADISSWGWMNGDIMSTDEKAKGMDSESQRIARECAYRAYHQFLKYNIENATDLIRESGFVDTTALSTALAGKQDVLTFDNVPTQSSNNPVKSGGVYDTFSTYCPIIEDTRTGVVADITGNAPFSQLVDGQRIVLHLNKNASQGNCTLNLTLSDNTTTGAKYIKVRLNSAFAILGTGYACDTNDYLPLVYNAYENSWLMLGHEKNTTYAGMTQAEVDAGTQTGNRVLSPKLLRDNFYTKTEIDNTIGDIETILQSI